MLFLFQVVLLGSFLVEGGGMNRRVNLLLAINILMLIIFYSEDCLMDEAVSMLEAKGFGG